MGQGGYLRRREAGISRERGLDMLLGYVDERFPGIRWPFQGFQ